MAYGPAIRPPAMRRPSAEGRGDDHYRDAYRRAVAIHPHAAPLSGSPVEASWDSRLTEAMLDAGRQIEEELVADDLLETLRSGGHAG